MIKVLITTSSFGRVDKEPLETLKKNGFDVTLNPYERKLSVEESKKIMSGYDALIAGTELLNHESLSTANNLKYICRLGAGMDSVNLADTQSRNIKVENTPSSHVDGVAELTLWGIISCLRSATESHYNLKNGNWVKPMGSLLKGKKVGIIGLGQVGKRLVKLLKPFEVKIFAIDAYPDKVFAEENGVKLTELNSLLKESDIISIHIPFTNENRYLLDEPQINMLKENAVLLNVSRGGLINEIALFKFLKQNSQASAYIDTFEEEPYNGPLKELNNIVLTPHIGSYAKEVRIAMEKEAANKVIKFFNE